MKNYLIIALITFNLAACSSDSSTTPASASVTVSDNPDPAINNGLFTLNMKGKSDDYDFEVFLSVDDQLSNSDISVHADGCGIISGCANNENALDLFWLYDVTISPDTNSGTDVATITTTIPYDGYIIVEFCAFADPNSCYNTAAAITLY